ESQDVELDAILGELCALETQFEREINQKGHSRTYNGSVASTTAVTLNLGPSTPTAIAVPSLATTATSPFSSGRSSQRSSGHSRSSSSSGGRSKLDLGPFQVTTPWQAFFSNGAPRTESPDNDSAFSDNVSMLSSESSASSGGGGNATRSSSAPEGSSSNQGPSLV
ncbi:unnamed protein product, partial [Ixodes pacificus]